MKHSWDWIVIQSKFGYSVFNVWKMHNFGDRYPDPDALHITSGSVNEVAKPFAV
jgi:hypothetical protein